MAEREDGLKAAMAGAVRGMGKALPIILSVVFLLGLFRTFVSPAQLQAVFTGSGGLDMLLGTVSGSLSTGNAVTSYVIGGELLSDGVRLEAVTAFLVAWVTVGLVQLPAEAALLGRRFALVRNATSALSAILVAIVTVRLVGGFA
ncbi:hypothetical protein [Halodesulfurarchaeum formicicum]|uniref:Permease n=2 Tax=Halodesulfurarchaeum formicicum TaxID=1873524 RepID=A0A1J1A8N8_9EURY|nr:hypothetical protein [Halodesulfurarchaeum formicicum]APE94486.1 hypothetical protein HSR6_0009 [Halodesulfurarchaeum formicicum]